MKHEYHEGPQAGENFKNLTRTVFQAPKVANLKRQSPKSTRQKKDGKNKA
jgi:hypothetical protein